MNIVPARFKFPYCVSFIPRQCRNERTRSLMGEGAVGLRAIEKHEAPDAYRLHYPKFDREPLRSRGVREIYFGDLVDEAYDIVIISYGGDLWTPLHKETPNPAVRGKNMENFLEGLADGSEACTWETQSVPRDQGAIEIARLIIANGHDEALTSAARRIYRNFLIRHDLVYVRRGVPLFIKERRNALHGKIDIGDAPPDRAIEPYPCVKSSRSWNFENELRSGLIWLPDQIAQAQTAADPLQLRIPTIQRLTDSPSSDLIVHIRSDAIVRETMRILLGSFSKWWSSEEAQSLRHDLRLACEEYGSDTEMSSRRLHAIQALFKNGQKTGGPEFNAIKRDFYDLISDFRNGSLPDPRSPIADSSCGLTEAEEAALEGL